MQMISWVGVRCSLWTKDARANICYWLDKKLEPQSDHFYTTEEVGKYPDKLITSFASFAWSFGRFSTEEGWSLQRIWRQTAPQTQWKGLGFPELQQWMSKIKRWVLLKSLFVDQWKYNQISENTIKYIALAFKSMPVALVQFARSS